MIEFGGSWKRWGPFGCRTGMKTRAVGYIRVSTDKQADFGVSLEAQRAQIEKYADLYEIELVAIEVDAGLSASSLDRPGLQRALERLDRFEADAILVAKLDRLTRSGRDLYTLIDTYFKDGSHGLLSVNDQIDTRSAAGRMLLKILVTISEWEREAIGERTAAAMQHLKANGRYTGGWPPFGYFVDDAGKLVEHESEQVIVTHAKTLRAQGLSFRAVAAAVGPNPRTGKAFDDKAIKRMIDSADALRSA